MARREIGEINAGSMADIAFLLLIFFLVTTTMETDEGITRILPQKWPKVPIPEIDIRKRDVFEVLVNAEDYLYVEEKYVDLKDIYPMCKEFMTNPENKEDLPEMILVTEELAKEKVNFFMEEIKKDSINNNGKMAALLNADLKDWQDKLLAVQVNKEPFRTLPKFAVISLQNNTGTSYKMYIDVQNELQRVINDLRDEKSKQLFNKSYFELDEKNEEDKIKLRVLRAIYPQKIAEKEPSNLGDTY
jgi:biopolymer transport protein ExbD